MDPFQRRDVVTVRIGKSGIGEPQLREIENVLKARGIVKVKLLRAYRDAAEIDRRETAARLAELLGAELVGVRGFVIMLKKRRRGAAPQSRSRTRRPRGRPRRP